MRDKNCEGTIAKEIENDNAYVWSRFGHKARDHPVFRCRFFQSFSYQERPVSTWTSREILHSVSRQIWHKKRSSRWDAAGWREIIGKIRSYKDSLVSNDCRILRLVLFSRFFVERSSQKERNHCGCCTYLVCPRRVDSWTRTAQELVPRVDPPGSLLPPSVSSQSHTECPCSQITGGSSRNLPHRIQQEDSVRKKNRRKLTKRNPKMVAQKELLWPETRICFRGG